MSSRDGRTGSRLNDRLTRLEYLAAFTLSAVLFLMHWQELRWGPVVLLFAYIDVIGYLPGLAVHLLRNGRVPKVFYVLYNVTHNLVVAAVVIGLWMLLIGPEWALLAVPLHLFGDRGLLGNLAKPFDEPFEGHAEPAGAAPVAGLEPVRS
jgi:hypothetical protein